MRNHIITVANMAINHCRAIPSFYRKNQQPHTTGETTMSKQQEHEIYCRLAKEIIESRLAVEPTQLRIHRLAKVIQTVDNEVYGC